MPQSRTLAELFARGRKQASNAELSLEPVDFVDGTYVMEPQVRVHGRGMTPDLVPLRIEEGERLRVRVTQGSADVRRDRYTGQLLVTPTGDEPVVASVTATGRLPSGPVEITAREVPVGIPGTQIPVAEVSANAAGGGACLSILVLSGIDIDVRVRSAIMVNVVPVTRFERRVNWIHGKYFAFDPSVGLMRLTYNTDKRSRLQMRAQAPEETIRPNEFFPATGRNELYFRLEFMDLGITAFNPEPMVQTIDRIEWPPFTQVLGIDRPVDFVDVENPDRGVLRLEKQTMHLYDYDSIDVDLLGRRITRDGRLVTRWRIGNQAEVPIRARWFALGDFVPNGKPAEGNRMLGPAGSGWDRYEFEWEAPVRKSTLRQSVSMNVVSLTEPVVAGIHRVDFHYPEPSGQRR